MDIRFSTEVIFDGDDACGQDASRLDGGPGAPYTTRVPVRLGSLDFLGGVYYNTLHYARTAGEACGNSIDLSDIITGTHDFSDELAAAI